MPQGAWHAPLRHKEPWSHSRCDHGIVRGTTGWRAVCTAGAHGASLRRASRGTARRPGTGPPARHSPTGTNRETWPRPPSVHTGVLDGLALAASMRGSWRRGAGALWPRYNQGLQRQQERRGASEAEGSREGYRGMGREIQQGRASARLALRGAAARAAPRPTRRCRASLVPPPLPPPALAAALPPLLQHQCGTPAAAYALDSPAGDGRGRRRRRGERQARQDGTAGCRGGCTPVVQSRWSMGDRNDGMARCEIDPSVPMPEPPAPCR